MLKNLEIHMFLTCVLKKKSLRLQHKQFKWPLGGFKLTGLHGNHQRAERKVTDILPILLIDLFIDPFLLLGLLAFDVWIYNR